MAKFLLEIEDDFDFGLIGISCHSKDYRICCALNKTLNIDMKREEDYVIDDKKFSFYQYIDNENHINYFLITNRSHTGFLIPEQKKVDYFLILKEIDDVDFLNHIIWKINNISLVLTSFKIDSRHLKSRHNLLF